MDLKQKRCTISQMVERLQEFTPEVVKISDYLYEIASNTAELKERPACKNKLIVVSGPPGCGKDAAMNMLLCDGSEFDNVATCTTRDRRPSEELNDPYIRYSMMDFIKADLQHQFLEINLHRSDGDIRFYGTPVSELERIWKEGHSPILRIDPRGAMNIRRMWKDGCPPLDQTNLTYFYITTPTTSELGERLFAREIKEGKDKVSAQRAVENRWPQVIDDLGHMMESHYVVVNYKDHLDDAVKAMRQVIR